MSEHKPVIGSSSLGSGIVGCMCMGAREFHALVGEHGGPAYAAWAAHFVEAAPVSTGPAHLLLVAFEVTADDREDAHDKLRQWFEDVATAAPAGVEWSVQP